MSTWSWAPSGPRWTAALDRLRAQLAGQLSPDPCCAPLVQAFGQLQHPRALLVMRSESPLLIAPAVSEEALGLLLLKPDGSYAESLDDARATLAAAWCESPGWTEAQHLLTQLSQESVHAVVAAARRVRAAAAPSPRPAAPRIAAQPRPVSAAGQPVRYLTDEQKAALNAKYGRLKPPTAAEMSSVASAAEGCKMQ